MTSKFLDYTGLAYLWGKIKEWCSSIFVTKATDENITGTKTFVGSKKIAFKQSVANDKLGFTLYNNSNKEQGYLEYNPTNKVSNVPLFTLGNYATAADELAYVGFRRYSNISGASGAYNLLAPLISDAKTPFNLTTTYTNFYLPLGISDGTNIVTASNNGVVDISSLLTLTGYTKASADSALATTDTIKQALGKLEYKIDNAAENIGDTTPIGTILYFTTNTPPQGFLVCDGTAVSRSLYSDLFDVIGTTYGSGDGSTTFNLPNLLDKFIEGTNSSVGTSVDAGLPNIVGAFWNLATTIDNKMGSTQQVFRNTLESTDRVYKATSLINSSAGDGIEFDASRYNAIYGNSSTVQPPAVKLLPCIKAYSSITNVNSLDISDLNDNCVHKTGTEFISGVKIFTHDRVANNYSSALTYKSANITKSAIPLTDQFFPIYFYDSSFSLNNNEGVNAETSQVDNLLALIEYTDRQDGSYDLKLTCEPRYNQTTRNVFQIGFDSNNNRYTEMRGHLSIYYNYASDNNPVKPAELRDIFSYRFYSDPADYGNPEGFNGYRWDCPLHIFGGTTTAQQGMRLGSCHGSTYITSGEACNALSILSGFPLSDVAGYEDIILAADGWTYLFSDVDQTTGSYSYKYVCTNTGFYLYYYNLLRNSVPASNTYTSLSSTRLSNTDANYSVAGIISAFYKTGTTSCYMEVFDRYHSNSTDTRNVGIFYELDRYDFKPSAADVNLGYTGNKRWKQLYATTTTISTSDERHKAEIDSIPDSILSLWENVNWCQFKFKNAIKEKGFDKARIHTGAIAQQILKAFKAENLSPEQYGFFCHDVWEAEEAKYDEEGTLREEAVEAGDEYSIRYEEALCIEAAYQRRKNKILENRISELEKQVSDMLILLQNLTNGNG